MALAVIIGLVAVPMTALATERAATETRHSETSDPEGDRPAERPVDRVADEPTARPVDSVKVRPHDRPQARPVDRPRERSVDRVVDRPADHRPLDRCIAVADNPRRCVDDRPDHDINVRHLIWRLIKAQEWEKLFRLLHRLGLI